MRLQTEAHIVGMALSREKNLHEIISAGISFADFSDERHQRLFAVLQKNLKQNLPVDLATVALSAAGGGSDLALYATELVEKAPLTQSPKFYAEELLHQKWADRVRSISSDLVATAGSRGFGDSSSAILEAARRLFDALHEQTGRRYEPRTLRDGLDKNLDDIIAASQREDHDGLIGVSSGIKKLDRYLHGFRQNALYVLAARPGRGKTTLGVNFALAALRAKKLVAYFTVEMPYYQLTAKLLSREARVDSVRLDTGVLTTDHLSSIERAVVELKEMGLYIDDSFAGSFPKVISTCEKLARRRQLNMVIVDYVQQLSYPGEKFSSRQAEISRITHELKQLAMRLKIPVIALAQVNRQGDQADVPSNIYLKDSGSIEQDADAVIFITKEAESQGKEGKTFLTITKNRYGRTDVQFPVRAEMHISKFSDEV